MNSILKNRLNKLLKATFVISTMFLFVQCADNSSSDSGGSTLTPQYAYITDGDDLKIIDVANPTSPTFVNSIAMNTSYFVSVSPGQANIAHYDAIEPYLSIVNIQNVNSLSSFALPKNSANNFSLLSDIYSIQGTAYFSDLYRGLNVVDPTNNSLFTNLGSDAMSVTGIGNKLYLIDQANGLSKYDISSPNSPSYTNVNNNTDVDTASYPDANFGQFHSWVENDGTYIYVANIIDKKLKKFDPVNLNLISEVSFEGYATAFAISNGFAYITTKAGNSPLQSSFDGISMFDLSTMTFTNFKALSRTSGVAINGNHCYVTDADGLHIYNISTGVLVLESTLATGYGNYIALGE